MNCFFILDFLQKCLKYLIFRIKYVIIKSYSVSAVLNSRPSGQRICVYVDRESPVTLWCANTVIGLSLFFVYNTHYRTKRLFCQYKNRIFVLTFYSNFGIIIVFTIPSLLYSSKLLKNIL